MPKFEISTYNRNTGKVFSDMVAAPSKNKAKKAHRAAIVSKPHLKQISCKEVD
ncbi:hypothetical protein [Culicoidibacter larvae]|uniref:hypothetical protein n=1 Tax=Culicoidibacter larvae TaxID=2579976 RepID=UPI0014855A4C|nr:hypothetical protein [Culicoidibacter larvae]